jgi:hypothetical protein
MHALLVQGNAACKLHSAAVAAGRCPERRHLWAEGAAAVAVGHELSRTWS